MRTESADFIDKSDHKSNSPLSLAVEKSETKVVKYLLKKGANADI